MEPINVDREREAFEKWVVSGRSPIPAGVLWDSLTVTAAWATWLARASLAADAEQAQWGLGWKVGDEYAPYHPDASHTLPDYRDGWNACYEAARPFIARTKAEQAHAPCCTQPETCDRACVHRGQWIGSKARDDLSERVRQLESALADRAIEADRALKGAP